MSEYHTAARARILQLLQEADGDSITAAGLCTALRQEQHPVNKSTVYRYLDRLVEEGDVLRYTDESGDRAWYQYVGAGRGCQEHLHLKCVCCGRLMHWECDYVQQVREHIREHHGFELQCEHSVLYGECADCRRRRLEKSAQEAR